MGRRIASPEMFPEAGMLPHLMCSRPIFIGRWSPPPPQVEITNGRGVRLNEGKSACAGNRRADKVSRPLGVEVGRHLDTRRAGDCRCMEPSGNPSDPHQIEHDVIAGLFPDGLEKRPRSVEVLAKLDGVFELPRELCVAREVIVRDVFFEPIEALIVKGMTAVKRVAEAEALVEVDHQLDVLADGPAHRSDGGDVVSEALPPEAQLQTLKPAFGKKRRRWVAEFAHWREP